MEFTGKVAIVTGAAQGIGASIAEMFGAEGACVFLVDINRDKGLAKTAELAAKGYKAEFIAADISKETDSEAMFDQVITKHGKVDFLINNAGVGSGKIRTCDALPKDLWDYILANDMTSVMLCSRRAGQEMVKRNYGKIVNIASLAAFKCGALSSPAYAAAKAGVINMTRTFSRDLAEFGINVNCIAPGVINTEMIQAAVPAAIAGAKAAIPLKRIGEPREIAATVRFLCSDGGAFIAGQTIDVNGGAFYR